MDPQGAILDCFLQLSYVTDSYSLIHQYKKGHIELETFIEIIQHQDTNISRQDISNFYTLTLKEAQFSLMTQFVLDRIFKKAGQIRAQRIEDHPVREPQELLQTLGRTLKMRGLCLDIIFKVFDRDWDQLLDQKEFQTLLEYYIPTITPQEFQQVLLKYPSKSIKMSQLEQWIGNGTTQSCQQLPTTKAKSSSVQTTVTTTNNTIQNGQSLKSTDKIKQPISNKESINKESNNNIPQADMMQDKLLSNKVKGLNEFEILLAQYDASGELYTDTIFPTTQQTLGALMNNYKWNRLGELWGDKHQIFSQGNTITGNTLKDLISANDVGQGELGNCYLVSVLASVAFQMPEIIYDLFITKKTNKSGLYAVKFCVDGQWQVVVMDDYIPVIGQQPAFCQSSNFESWVILLEKAWAKLHGSYSNTKGGVPTEVEQCLTQGPSWILETDDKDFKARLQSYFCKKCIMTVGTKQTGVDYKQKQLVAGHAYSLLSQHSVNHPKLGTVELVKIRNPYGRVEWNGDWGDKSPLWTLELRKAHGLEDKDDGEFYMNYQDFMSNYSTVFASYFRKNYMYSSTTSTIKKKNSQYFTFEIESDGEYYFTAYQKSARQFKSQYKDYQNSQIRLLIGCASNEGYTYFGAVCKTYDSVYYGGQFKKGTYVAQVKIPWKYWPEFEFTVSLYGEKSVDINQIPKIPEFTQQVMLSLARLNPIIQPLTAKEPNITKSESMKPEIGLGYFYFNNLTGRKGLVLQWTFKNMEGFKLKKPFRGNTFKLTIPAGQDAIVLSSLDASGYSMQLSQSLQYF